MYTMAFRHSGEKVEATYEQALDIAEREHIAAEMRCYPEEYRGLTASEVAEDMTMRQEVESWFVEDHGAVELTACEITW